jgi:DNA repair protein RecN (Recombination protein N)
LDLVFREGLCVLTGETGAGKSILLDALGLALGMRAESGLVRAGAQQAVAAAEFTLSAQHPARALLAQAGLENGGDRLVLRRIVAADGRSRAFVDDQPASVGMLRQIGESLVEIHGQFEQHGLLDSGTHRDTLDAYGGYADSLREVRVAWTAWRDHARQRSDAEQHLMAARDQEIFLLQARDEIAALDPKRGEETALAEERILRSNKERIGEALEAALEELQGQGQSGERALNAAIRQLDKIKDKAGGRVDLAVAALERAAIEIAEGIGAIHVAARDLGRETANLAAVEDRLYALRALARKHGVSVDALSDLNDEITARLASIEDGEEVLRRLRDNEVRARNVYLAAAESVSHKRRLAAKALDQAVIRELPPLKLEAAKFITVVSALEENDWGEFGREHVHFEVSTNRGAAAGPLARIASGGELSRFMLALKIVLSKVLPVPTLVFDEVDSGIGGPTAAAVGERLRRLATEMQVLVVTHSPQVAALGQHHWRVTKEGNTANTRVDMLPPEERREEIARMLSGSAITPAARAAADSLMTGART